MRAEIAAQRLVTLASPVDFAGWRDAARRFVQAGVTPADVRFTDQAGGVDLFAGDAVLDTAPGSTTFRVSKTFVDLAEQAALHRDADRYDLLYRILWRLRDEPALMALASDPDVVRLNAMVKAVRRDIHKMHAFVRFRRVETDGQESFVAWYEPDHHTVEAGTPFFARRFATMDFAILTPECCAFHPANGDLTFGPGADRASAPADDELEDLWRRYYASTFNPARPKPDMMRREMPTRFWKNLPEAQLIEPLLREAQGRAETMIDAAPTLPVARRGAEWTKDAMPAADATSLEGLRAEAAACKLCPLWEPATQTVFGEGGAHASLVFVGEQPGDKEDIAGHPFVGPAGQVFDRALKEAGIDRREAYVTNAVKHFKFEPRGKRRIHKKPSVGEIRACSTWLDRELNLVQPDLIVMLGASAAQAVLRRTVTIGRKRGQPIEMANGRTGFVTVHPSYILRVQGEEDQARAYAEFVRDLRAIADLAGLSAQARAGSPS